MRSMVEAAAAHYSRSRSIATSGLSAGGIG